MSDIWTILTPLLRLAFYPALLLATGGVIFSALMGRALGPELRMFTGRVTGRAAIAGACLAAFQIPAAAGNMSGDLAGMADPVLIALVFETPAGAAALMAVAGFLLILIAETVVKDPWHPLRITGPGLVILSMLLAGHVTTGGIATGLLLAIHLAGLGFWMGALLPLRAICRDPETYGGRASLADLADLFGRRAMWIVPVLLIAGILYSAILLGSVAALATTSYGLVLVAKISFVGGVIGLAAFNKFRLVPAVRAGSPDALAGLARSIGWEIAGVIVILLATSLMTTSLLLPGGMPMGDM